MIDKKESMAIAFTPIFKEFVLFYGGKFCKNTEDEKAMLCAFWIKNLSKNNVLEEIVFFNEAMQYVFKSAFYKSKPPTVYDFSQLVNFFARFSFEKERARVLYSWFKKLKAIYKGFWLKDCDILLDDSFQFYLEEIVNRTIDCEYINKSFSFLIKTSEYIFSPPNFNIFIFYANFFKEKDNGVKLIEPCQAYNLAKNGSTDRFIVEAIKKMGFERFRGLPFDKGRQLYEKRYMAILVDFFNRPKNNLDLHDKSHDNNEKYIKKNIKKEIMPNEALLGCLEQIIKKQEG